MAEWNPDCTSEPCVCPGTEVGTVFQPDPETILAEVMTEVAIAELPVEAEPAAIVEGLGSRGYVVQKRPVIDCRAHTPTQHRDRKRPWCNNCGRAADGELIGRPRAFGPR